MKPAGKSITTIAVTGTIGAGKSTVGQICTELGIPVIDTDKIVHNLLATNKEVKNDVKQFFPQAIEIKDTEEEISRKKLGKIVFNDKEAKRKLESILHPRVREVCREEMDKLANSANKPRVVITLIPLLFESGRQTDYDQTWTVITDENILRQRLVQRDNFSVQEIESRLAGQMPQAEKAKLADKVLDNSGSLDQLRQQVLKLLADLKKKPIQS